MRQRTVIDTSLSDMIEARALLLPYDVEYVDSPVSNVNKLVYKKIKNFQLE